MVTNSFSEIHINGKKYTPHFITKKYERYDDYIESQIKNSPLEHLAKCTKHNVAIKLKTGNDFIDKPPFKDKYFFPWFVLYKSFSALLIGVLFSSFIDKKAPSDSI